MRMWCESESKALEMSTAVAIVSLGGLALVENRDHPSRNWEQGRGGGVPRFEAML